MSRKRTRKRQMSKYKNDAMIGTGTIDRIDFINFKVGDKLKTVFYVKTYYAPEGRMCILWGPSNIQIGDEVSMKGRFSDGVFLVWSLQILKKNRAGQIGCIQN